MNMIQNKLFSMLIWFQEICKKENLIYYALGGTALGDIRHNGFIPWDDDIDLGMPRDSYNKLKTVFKDYNSEHYCIEFPGSNSDFIYPFCKIYDKTTTLIENARGHAKRGVFIDVFPLDGIGDTVEESIKKYKSFNKRIDLLNTMICEPRKGRSWYKNIAIRVSHCIPKFLLSTDRLIEDINNAAEQVRYFEKNYIVNWFGQWKTREICKKSWFGTPVLHEFESGMICVPQYTHEYLKNVYGDYMKLPPKEKQVTHHDYVYINLNEPYTN